MITVNFTNDIENLTCDEHLYQWDNGQKLSISGVGTIADVHFANKKSEKALVVTPTVQSDTLIAPIPNSLLAEPYPIIAYVYVPSDDGAKTIKTVTIFVNARKQPSDFVIEEDEGITTLDAISQRANQILTDAMNDINELVNSSTVTNAENAKNAEKLGGKSIAKEGNWGVPFINVDDAIDLGSRINIYSKTQLTGYIQCMVSGDFDFCNNLGGRATINADTTGDCYTAKYASVPKNSTSTVNDICLRNISAGSGEATASNCPAGSLYCQFEVEG